MPFLRSECPGHLQGTHRDTYWDTYWDTHRDTHRNGIELDANRRGPICGFCVWLVQGEIDHV
jgi:hypothetical protein